MCISKYSGVKCELIYPITKVGRKWVLQRDNDHKDGRKFVAEKEKNQCILTAQSESRPEHDGNALVGH